MSIPPLYHYTDNAGLIGIVKNEELWFSHINFLNDSREFKHACDVLAYNITNYPVQYREMWLERGCREEQFDGMMRNMRDQSNYSYILQMSEWNGSPFIFSMSEARDALSQWRAYGNGEYCVKFDFSKLDSNPSPKPVKVIYSDKDSGIIDADVQTALGNFFKTYVRNIYAGGQIDLEIYYQGLLSIVNELLRGDFFAKHKDNGFSEEAEWRLVIHMRSRDQNIFFTPGRRYPLPRTKIKTLGNGQQLSNFISEAMCGPGIDFDLFKTCMSFLIPSSPLKSLSLSSSKVPYRSY